MYLLSQVDVGAADGKVMLGALALGAARSYGLEVSGPALRDKFEAMLLSLRSRPAVQVGVGELLCNTDITELDGNVERWLADCFASFNAVAGNVAAAPAQPKRRRDIAVSAVWHGFNVEAKEALLAALADSQRVSTFTLVGPTKKDYGTSAKVLDFVQSRRTDGLVNVAFLHDDTVKLAGGGESYHALTFEILDRAVAHERVEAKPRVTRSATRSVAREPDEAEKPRATRASSATRSVAREPDEAEKPRATRATRSSTRKAPAV